MVLNGAAEMGVAPERCVVIGDIGSDIAVARTVGAGHIMVPTSATLRRGGGCRHSGGRSTDGLSNAHAVPPGTDMRRTLLCRLDNAGDVLLTGPAVRAAAAGSDRVLFLAGPRGMEAAEMLPGVDDVMVHRAAWIDPDGQLWRPAIDQLIERIADFAPTDAVVFTSLHQSPLPTALLLRMAVFSIAAISDDYPGTLLDVRHRIDPNIHEVERNLSLVATLGFRLPPGDDGRLRVLVDPPPLGQVRDTPFVVVHPGASVPARTAPPDGVLRNRRGTDREGWHVVVTGAARRER